MSQLNRTRVNNVLKRMAEAGVEQMIVTSPISIFYLTGEMVHPGERCLALYLNTDGNVTLVVNQLHNYIKLDGAKVVFFHDTEDPVAILAKEVKPGKLGVDKEWPGPLPHPYDGAAARRACDERLDFRGYDPHGQGR